MGAMEPGGYRGLCLARAECTWPVSLMASDCVLFEPANFVQCEGVKVLQEAGVEVICVEAPGLLEECLAPNNHILKSANTGYGRAY